MEDVKLGAELELDGCFELHSNIIQRWLSVCPLLSSTWKAWCFNLFWNYFLDRGQKFKLTGQLLTDNTTLVMISWWTFTIRTTPELILHHIKKTKRRTLLHSSHIRNKLFTSWTHHHTTKPFEPPLSKLGPVSENTWWTQWMLRLYCW